MGSIIMIKLKDLITEGKLREANIIQKIDKLAKANKYGTVDGTRMNGKTAKEIMAIFMHPKMNSYRQQMMGMKSHELVDLTLTLLKKLNIKVEGEVNESRANVLKAIKIAKKMKGNMTGAVNKIEKIQKGLSKQIEVVDALKTANESTNEANSSEIRKKLLTKFGKDPLYKDFIVAKTPKEQKKALDTLKSIRGANAIRLMQKYVKVLQKESDLGYTTKKQKTVQVKHKTSGKTLVVIDTPSTIKQYKKLGYVVKK